MTLRRLLGFALLGLTFEARAQAPMLTRHSMHTGITLSNGRVLVVGGTIGAGAPELYDPNTDSWTPAGTLGTPRQSPAVAVLADGRVLLAGGLRSSAPALATDVDLYDPVTNTWSPGAPLSAGRELANATTLSDGRVLVVGGADPSTGQMIIPAELYDPATNTWSPAGSMGRINETLTLLPDGRVLLTGGFNNGGGPMTSTKLYDPATNTWADGPRMGYARSRHRAALLPSGLVLVAGGEDPTSAGTAELYDPATNAWSYTGFPSGGTGIFDTFTLLRDGRVVLTGGINTTNPIAVLLRVLIYDPGSRLWDTGAPALSLQRYGHSASLLPDGRILIAGGATTPAAGSETSSVEFYLPPAAPDFDGDGVMDSLDNCPLTSNPFQADMDGDGVGDLCDNCVYAWNPRVTPDSATFLAANPWATLTGGQRDDDHDGYGNVCDADFPGTSQGGNPNAADTAQFKKAIGSDRRTDVCGASGDLPCAVFDLNLGQNTDGVNNINAADSARYKLLLGSPAGPRCPACPLTCEHGATGSCD